MQRVMWSQYGMVPKISKGTDDEAGTRGRAQSQTVMYLPEADSNCLWLFINDCKHSSAFLMTLINVMSLLNTINM